MEIYLLKYIRHLLDICEISPMQKEKISSIILFKLIFLFTDSYSQEDKGIISGSVKDKISLQPLPGAFEDAIRAFSILSGVVQADFRIRTEI